MIPRDVRTAFERFTNAAREVAAGRPADLEGAVRAFIRSDPPRTRSVIERAQSIVNRMQFDEGTTRVIQVVNRVLAEEQAD